MIRGMGGPQVRGLYALRGVLATEDRSVDDFVEDTLRDAVQDTID